MPTSTPDVEKDLVERLAVLAPSLVTITGSSRDTWPGPERPSSGAGFPLRATFAQHVGGIDDLHSDGRMRTFDMQLLVRGARNAYGATLALARGIYDALDLSGAFTGASGARYLDVRGIGPGPAYLGAGDSDAEFFAVNVRLLLDG